MVTSFTSAASRAETFARPALTAADRGACTWFAALLAGLLLAIPGQGLHAAEQPPGANLVSVHAWLLQHNPDLRALQAETEAAEAQILPAGALPDPMATLGLRGETSHDTRWGQLMPFGRLELQHDFDNPSEVRIGYADLNGGQGYAISSSPIGRNRVQIGFGSRLQSRVGTFAAELQFTRSNTSFQRGLRLLYTTRY